MLSFSLFELLIAQVILFTCACNQFENEFLISLIVFVVYVIFNRFFDCNVINFVSIFIISALHTFRLKKDFIFFLFFRHHSLNDTKQKKMKTMINRKKKQKENLMKTQ